jgi:hypothetical protein
MSPAVLACRSVLSALVLASVPALIQLRALSFDVLVLFGQNRREGHQRWMKFSGALPMQPPPMQPACIAPP